jgi:hypothetical protein
VSTLQSTSANESQESVRSGVNNARARQNINKENAIALTKIGVAVFPSSGKVPLVPLYNRLDTEIAPEDREAAIAKYREDHDDQTPVHVGSTKDFEVIKRMWRAFRDAVPSIATGPSGLVVMDADAKDDGPAKMKALFKENGGLPVGTIASPTKSGGLHFIFADPERAFTNKAGLLKKNYGCDVRGSGGQIVAPGSMLDDGRSYGTRDYLVQFMRAFVNKSFPPPPGYITELIGSLGDTTHTQDEVAPSKEREAIQSLRDADWEHHENNFDPTLGKYDLDQLKAENAGFKQLYDNPSADCSTNRFLAARHVMRKWPDMPAPALSIFFSQWEGAGSYTDEKPKSGEYDDRQIAREWLKNRGLSKPSNGDAFGAVDDVDDDTKAGLRNVQASSDRAVVQVNLNNPAAIVEEVEDILIRVDAQIFRRGPILVEVVADKPLPGLNATVPIAHLLPVNVERLAQLTGRYIDFQRFDARSKGFVSCKPPQELMNHMLSIGVRSKLRRVTMLVATPLIRPDGTILSKPGYDLATEVYLDGDIALPPMVECPTIDEGRRALEFAAGLFAECAFADKGPGYPHTSVSLSAVLSVVVASMARLLVFGIPMLTCTAATPGSGKSFIGRLIGIWVTGRDVPVSNVASGSAGELDKRLNAGLLGGAPMIHIDNANGKLVSDLLCQILTERSVAVRPLGVSEEVVVIGMPLVLANGNNVQIDDNLSRRTLLVELDAGVEKPELRNFNLRPVDMLVENRGSYVAAILTALRAYLMALERGETTSIRPRVGSFEEWSDFARSLVIWYGFRDPIEAMAIAQAEDPEKAARSAVFRGLQALFSDRRFTAGNVIERLERAEYDTLDELPPREAEICRVIRDNLRGLLHDHSRGLNAPSLAGLFKSWATKVEAGLKLVRLERNVENVTTYAIINPRPA